jgi:chemotaxis-related protein WspB
MLYLLFQVGSDQYALEAVRVVEVVPLLGLTKIPRAPKGVAGLFNYRGRPVPAVDLCELALNKPAEERLSTRIIIVNYPDAGRNREERTRRF